VTTVALVSSIASVALLYSVGARLFASARFGILTAALFSLTPLIWHQAQSAPAALVPLAFVVGWLWAVAHLEHADTMWWAAIAGGLLGVGVYTSLAAVVMMPLYLLITIVVFASHGAARSRQLRAMIAGFVIAVGPFLVWLLRHPDVLPSTVNAYHLYDANRFSLRQGVREMMSWVGLTARTEVYYDYFNPAFLFLTGRVFLFPLILLVPVGLYEIAVDDARPPARLSMVGFFVAPFAASLTADAPTPSRILFLTPFAAIVSTYGLKRLLAWRRFAAKK
jgi:4-amino-4-deoxy-L-arabinose transferase-like glycosyltransferase